MDEDNRIERSRQVCLAQSATGALSQDSRITLYAYDVSCAVGDSQILDVIFMQRCAICESKFLPIHG